MIDFRIADKIILNALEEDMPMGDLTTDSIFDGPKRSTARIISREDAVLAGIDVFARVFEILDPGIVFRKYFSDGDAITKGCLIAEVEGDTRVLLKGERTALNLLQRMSGIATRTREFCRLIEGTGARLADTRKTAPGLRYLDKYAVRAGGGTNHRFCLSDGILIKDNHIQAAGGITAAVTKVRAAVPHTLKIEVETETMDQVREALAAGADIIMLDNMSPAMMKDAVKLISKRALVEASGTVRPDNVKEVAQTGVDIISTGNVTHSVKAVDISMKFGA